MLITNLIFQTEMSKKICLLVGSLSSGGAEKVAANMSISLTKRGYDITIVSMTNFIDYPFEGKLYNFGLVKEQYGRLKSFLKFKQYFKENEFEYIIDHRTRNKYFKELLFSKCIFQKCKIIYCVHSYRLAYYFSFLSFSTLSVFPHVKQKIFVSVCEEIAGKLKQKLNIESKTIYNFISANDFAISLNDNQFSNQTYIIGVGKLTKIKQFDKLIRSYQASKLYQNGIKLFILGDGPEKENLENLISSFKLENYINLLPFRKNPYGVIRNAKALVLTSKTEGFPMVLLEALMLNTPIIAFNCKSGPGEVIINEQNGLLVDDQNEKELTMALNKLLLDNTYYNNIKANTHAGVEKFTEERIIQEWVTLLENQM